MRTVVVLLLSVAAISCAQDRKADNNDKSAPGAQNRKEKKRLESVTWDLKTQKLVWVVQKGYEQNGQFVAQGSDRYEILPDDAVMAFSNQKRGFTQEEATSLQKLLDTLSLYCAESVIWWEQGEGTPLDGNSPSPTRKAPKDSAPAPNRQRVDHGAPQPTVDSGLLVASAAK